MALSKQDVQAAIRPLRLVVVGGFLYALDLPVQRVVDGRGWRVDVLNDAVGMLLVYLGVRRLARIRVDEPWRDRYGSAMRVVEWVVLLGVAQGVMGHVVFDHPPILDIFLAVYGLCQLAAVVLLCLCMRSLCVRTGLARSAAGWQIALAVFMGCFGVPAIFYYYSTYLTLMGYAVQRVDRTLVSILGQALLVAPLIYACLLVSRMAKEADEPPAAAGAGSIQRGR